MQQQTKEWTLMFYFASDNPLASTIVTQLKALKAAGYHPDANVIAQFDPHVVNTPVHVFDVNGVNKFWKPGQSEVGFTPNDPFVRDLVLDRLWGENHREIRELVVDHVSRKERKLNTDAKFDPPRPSPAVSDEQTPLEALESFLNFCRRFYPARHYLLFILGHGQVVGNDSLLYDEHAAKNSLVLTDLGHVLRTFNDLVQREKEPGVMEMIGLHSCSMSALEVAFELRGAANYMLASQGPSYVGSWPYKQILIRIFNDLNSELTPEDINGVHKGQNGKQTFVEKLSRAEEPVFEFLRSKLARTTKEALANYRPGKPPEWDLVSRIVHDFNGLLNSREMANTLPSNNGIRELRKAGLDDLNEVKLRKLNRLLLAESFPEIAKAPSLDTMLTRIFYYCLYNSYDFQLAGYPYHLSLTNLTQLSNIEKPIDRLADSLIEGLNDKNQVTKQLILLSHWDAQSFYGEEYIDLYDFCFCLKQRFAEIDPDADLAYNEPQQAILDACDWVMNVLEKGSGNLITQSAFSGAAFQYSHGLSIYFPWSEPVSSEVWDRYTYYQLNRSTRWRKFLEEYFKTTMRKTRIVEIQKARERAQQTGGQMPAQEKPEPAEISAEILTLMGQIGAHVFDAEGQLQKPGPDSPLGKYGPDDPTGSNCNCPTIKNHPLYTGNPFGHNGKEVKTLAFSEDFFAGRLMTIDPPDNT